MGTSITDAPLPKAILRQYPFDPLNDTYPQGMVEEGSSLRIQIGSADLMYEFWVEFSDGHKECHIWRRLGFGVLSEYRRVK